MDKGYKAVTYDTGEIEFRGVYLDGVFTRQMALAIKEEATQVLKFFDLTDEALKKSMEKTK